MLGQRGNVKLVESPRCHTSLKAHVFGMDLCIYIIKSTGAGSPTGTSSSKSVGTSRILGRTATEQTGPSSLKASRHPDWQLTAKYQNKTKSACLAK